MRLQYPNLICNNPNVSILVGLGIPLLAVTSYHFYYTVNCVIRVWNYC